MEIPEKFWKEYKEKDMLERDEHIKVVIDGIIAMDSIKDKKLRRHALTTTFRGYFDDLIDLI